ncbi:hypothetical protein NDI45_16945 [Leptolyngbya sp. GB1-A1]|uniref:hypothetical protein n=1 Tax=Leptolyngbya sp. GB1-A1 TaxID=2933908 RepID=UPI003298D355
MTAAKRFLILRQAPTPTLIKRSLVMPSSNFYWSRNLISGFGKMWFLITPQETDSNGGGASLLGSVVEEFDGGLFSYYPAPYHMATPKLIRDAIELRRDKLNLDNGESIVLEIKFASLRISTERRKSIKSGIGNFPSIPVFLDVDYSRMVSITVELESAKMQYISTDYLSRLYKLVDGDDNLIEPSLGIDIDNNYIVDQILLANQYNVIFESDSNFSSQFEAEISFVNAQNAGKISVSLDRVNKKRVTAKVHNGQDYLVAFKVIDWDDLG